MVVQQRWQSISLVVALGAFTCAACSFDSSGTGTATSAGTESESEANSESESASDTSGGVTETSPSGSDSDASTDGPTTDGPTTDGPTTDGPTTDEPTTDGPTTDEPTTDDPTTDDPTTDDPTDATTEEPTTDDPTDDPSDTDCDPVMWWEDSDGDGFGDPEVSVEACEQPEGYVDNPHDCRDKGDGAEAMSPSLDEVCDSFDNDCDGVVNEFSPENNHCNNCALSQHNGRSYFFCEVDREWEPARTYCGDNFGPLVDLVVINDGDENGYIQGNFGNARWWIGLSDKADEGTFVWVDGTPLGYEDWGTTEPNDFFGEDCVTANDNAWRDEACDGDHRFVCEGPS